MRSILSVLFLAPLLALAARVPVAGDDPYPLPKPAETKPSRSDEATQALAHALCDAIDAGDRAAVEKALADGADVETGIGAGEATTAGRTPLIHAVVAKRKELVELLVARGARLEHGDAAGHTPLMYSALTKDVEIADVLLRLGARVDAKDDDERGAIDYVEDSEPVAKRLVEVGAKNHDLLFAVAKGEYAAARALIAEGASPNANDGKVTLLVPAARSGDLAFVESLLAAGARPDLVLTEGLTSTTPLSIAAQEAPLDVVKLLLKDRKPSRFALDDALACAADCAGADCLERVKLLLAAGADPTMDSVLQRPPLAAAAKRGDLPMLAVLLQAGADQNAVDRALLEAAGIAEADSALAVVRALLAIGADPAHDHFYANALGVAAEHAHVPVLEALFAKASDEGLNTAVAEAAREGRDAGLAWLCEHGKGRIDFAFRPGIYSTALVGAIEKGHRECVKLLLAAGADANAEASFDQDSPLIAAVRVKDVETIRMLLAAGADPRKKSETMFRGELSALSVAREVGDEAILALLRGGKDGESGARDLTATLEESGLRFSDLGRFLQLRYSNSETNRSQSVYVRKTIDTFESLRTQEVYSLAWESKTKPTKAQLLQFFKRSFGLGGLVLESPTEGQTVWRVRFRVAVPCDTSSARLREILDLVQGTADQLEQEFAPDAEDRL